VLYCGCVVASCPSQQPQTTATPKVSLSITDLSPKFFALYEEAVRENASPGVRWELWKKLYHFAAVPPRLRARRDAMLAAPKPLAQSVQHESNFWLEEQGQNSEQQ